jgi:ABC-type hemin transport system ATPase subunit
MVRLEEIMREGAAASSLLFSVHSNTSHSGVPGLNAEFKRINVIMGANGSGKSRLLQQLAADCEKHFSADYTPVLIEGGRAVALPIDVGLSRETMRRLERLRLNIFSRAGPASSDA